MDGAIEIFFFFMITFLCNIMLAIKVRKKNFLFVVLAVVLFLAILLSSYNISLS
jgi:hypothetical protein